MDKITRFKMTNTICYMCVSSDGLQQSDEKMHMFLQKTCTVAVSSFDLI